MHRIFHNYGNISNLGTDLSNIIGDLNGWTIVDSELILKDGTQYFFNSTGQVTQIVDKTGLDQFSVNYNADLTLANIQDDLGQQVNFAYTNNGLPLQRPSISSITSTGFQGSSRSVTYTYNTSFSAINFLNQLIFLPELQSSEDVLGRITNYGYWSQFVFSGGGSVTLDFLALLANIADDLTGDGDVLTQILNIFGINALTLSGNMDIEYPFLINQITLPSKAVTNVDYAVQDITAVNVQGADLLLGIPTALMVSYNIVAKLVARSQFLEVNGSLVEKLRILHMSGA